MKARTGARRFERAIPCNDDVAATGEGTSDGLPSLTTHQDRVSHRDAFEMSKVFGDVPRHVAVQPDHPIRVHRDDDRQHRARPLAARPRPAQRLHLLEAGKLLLELLLQQRRALVAEIEAHKVDLIIGTQIIAKGYHFPLLTLVGAVDADLGLQGGDLRAAERTYQLLYQVAGRAGREKKPGRVFLQTYMASHPVIQALTAGDREKFLFAEKDARRSMKMPPFGRLVSLIVSGFSIIIFLNV